MANSEDLDQTPHNAASDLDLHCLLCPTKGTSGLYGLKTDVMTPWTFPV